MLFDLGVNHDDLNNETLVRKKISEIEEDFDLVMIAEYFYESLILLRHELCWSLEDVTSFQLNARIKSDENKMKKSIEQLDAFNPFLLCCTAGTNTHKLMFRLPVPSLKYTYCPSFFLREHQEVHQQHID